MVYLFCATFVFGTTRISALTIQRLQRDGITEEGRASGFASVKSMGMLLFASMKRGPSPYPTVLKMLQKSRLYSITEASRLVLKLLVHHLLLCSVEDCEGLYKVRAGSL